MKNIVLRILSIYKKPFRAKCPNCNSSLSEWFRQDGDKMRCFDCGHITDWHTHEEAKSLTRAKGGE